jgi:hypothetical protein
MLHAFAFLQVSVLYICLLFSHASRVIDIARLAQDGQNRVQAHRTVVSDYRDEHRTRELVVSEKSVIVATSSFIRKTWSG